MPRYLFPISLMFLFACNFTRNNDNYTLRAKKYNSDVVMNEMKTSAAINFINGYVKNCNKMKEAVPVVEWVDKSESVTQEFKTALKKLMDDAYLSEPETGLDADPIFNAQDYPENGFDLEKVDRSNNMVYLKGIDWPDFKLIIRMKKQNDRWLVDGCGMVNM